MTKKQCKKTHKWRFCEFFFNYRENGLSTVFGPEKIEPENLKSQSQCLMIGHKLMMMIILSSTKDHRTCSVFFLAKKSFFYKRSMIMKQWFRKKTKRVRVCVCVCGRNQYISISFRTRYFPVVVFFCIFTFETEAQIEIERERNLRVYCMHFFHFFSLL